MSCVKTDIELLNDLQLKLLEETSLLNSLTYRLSSKYAELGESWRDEKYATLGDILMECVRANRRAVRELDSTRGTLDKLIAVVKEYEEADIHASQLPPEKGEEGSNLASGGQWPHIAGTHTRAEDLAATNPGHETNPRRRDNCQRCVPAYFMRRRGYDVRARPTPGGSSRDYLQFHPEHAWQNAEVLGCNGSGMTDITSQMLAWGEGAQAEVAVVWRRSGRGHVFIAEVVNGEVVFSDPQDESRAAENYFGDVEIGRTRFWRVDILEPSELIRECCERTQQ